MCCRVFFFVSVTAFTIRRAHAHGWPSYSYSLWLESVSRPADKDYAFDMESHQRNTECFQGHQSMYNPNTKLHDIVTQNTGHWGKATKTF